MKLFNNPLNVTILTVVLVSTFVFSLIVLYGKNMYKLDAKINQVQTENKTSKTREVEYDKTNLKILLKHETDLKQIIERLKRIEDKVGENIQQ